MASSWFLSSSYHNDARSNKHQVTTGIFNRTDFFLLCQYGVTFLYDATEQKKNCSLGIHCDDVFV